jgi:hypothetical protein
MGVNLGLFCDPERRAPGADISVPFSLNGHTYATNGHICVRVPRCPGVPENEQAPNVESCPGISRASSLDLCPNSNLYPTNAGSVLVGAINTAARTVVVSANIAMEPASSPQLYGSARLRSVH